jgi:hypothetical protein
MSPKSNGNGYTKHTPELIDSPKSSFGIVSSELKSKFESGQHLMVFDIGDKKRFDRQHIPGSEYAVCQEKYHAKTAEEH